MSDQATATNRGDEPGLVRLLLILTLVTGSVDAVSILRLDHIFVANMTGNVVFLGFALAGASGFSVRASLVALGAFLAGAAIGGRLFTATTQRMRLLGCIALGEAALCAGATVVFVAAQGAVVRSAVTVLLAAAMGAQNAMARRVAIANLTTTVLTLTLTGLAADPTDLTHPNAHTERRLAAVAAMLSGAVGGAILVLHVSTASALGTAAALLTAVAVAALSTERVTR